MCYRIFSCSLRKITFLTTFLPKWNKRLLFRQVPSRSPAFIKGNQSYLQFGFLLKQMNLFYQCKHACAPGFHRVCLLCVVFLPLQIKGVQPGVCGWVPLRAVRVGCEPPETVNWLKLMQSLVRPRLSALGRRGIHQTYHQVPKEGMIQKRLTSKESLLYIFLHFILELS